MTKEELKVLKEMRDALRIIAGSLHTIAKNDASWKAAEWEESLEEERPDEDSEFMINTPKRKFIDRHNRKRK